MEIIGVVKDFKYKNLREDIPVQAFVPYLGTRYIGEMTAYVRTTADPNQLMATIRSKLRDMDSNIPIYAMRTTEVQINNSLSAERMIASLSAVFGLLATMLAVIGIYGVMAYTVAQRDLDGHARSVRPGRHWCDRWRQCRSSSDARRAKPALRPDTP